MEFRKKVVRNDSMTIRLTQDEKKIICDFCNRCEIGMSDFVRAVALDYIKTHKEDK